MLVIACALLALWCHTCLEVVLRLAVLQLLPVVELARLRLEVLLHHIEVVLVVFLVDARVAPNENAEIVKRLCDESALLLHLDWVLVEEGLNVNHWYFC